LVTSWCSRADISLDKVLRRVLEKGTDEQEEIKGKTKGGDTENINTRLVELC